MQWDESKHPRDRQGKFTTADYKAMSIDELKDESTVQLSENAKYVEVTPITDDAINNVPVVDIPGYTKEECEYIAEQHKELLRYARDKNLHNEVAFVYREGFKNRLVLKGESDTIDFNYVMQGKGNGIVILHNHPRNHTFLFGGFICFWG